MPVLASEWISPFYTDSHEAGIIVVNPNKDSAKVTVNWFNYGRVLYETETVELEPGRMGKFYGNEDWMWVHIKSDQPIAPFGLTRAPWPPYDSVPMPFYAADGLDLALNVVVDWDALPADLREKTLSPEAAAKARSKPRG